MIITIKDYLGLLENGVLVLCTVEYKDSFYEGTFWYNTAGERVFTVNGELEKLIGKINTYDIYSKILEDLSKNVVPISELQNKLQKIDKPI
jgi:hypothetical protein